MSDIKIEIVTPVHNRCEITRKCLESLENIDRRGLNIHIFVVDDGSSDGTEQMLANEFPEVSVIRGDGNLWYTAGSNRGLEAALLRKPDYILLINNDCIFDPTFLVSMLETARANRRSIVGAVLIDWNDREKIFQVSPEWRIFWGGIRHWRHQTIYTIPDTPWKVDLIVGNCTLFPVQAIREAGLMDESRLPQFGDAEYTPRMRRLGWTLLIEPRAKVFCKPNDIPERIRTMSTRRLLQEIFLNPHSGQSLKRRYYMSLGSAPNKLSGLIAFFVFFIRFAIGRNFEGPWGQSRIEPPISEMYSRETVSR